MIQKSKSKNILEKFIKENLSEEFEGEKDL